MRFQEGKKMKTSSVWVWEREWRDKNQSGYRSLSLSIPALFFWRSRQDSNLSMSCCAAQPNHSATGPNIILKKTKRDNRSRSEIPLWFYEVPSRYEPKEPKAWLSITNLDIFLFYCNITATISMPVKIPIYRYQSITIGCNKYVILSCNKFLTFTKKIFYLQISDFCLCD